MDLMTIRGGSMIPPGGSEVGQLHFRADGVYIESLLVARLGLGMGKTREYASCKVTERHYWKFVNHYVLVFTSGRKAIFSICTSSRETSYEKIKAEIQRRLGEGAHEHDNPPMARETLI
jgi:hypothetical protein